MTQARPSRPRAFRLDDPKIVFADREAAPRAEPRTAAREERFAPPQADSVVVEPQSDAYETEADLGARDRTEAAIEVAQRSGIVGRRSWTWSRLFWSALGSLVSLALGLWLTSLVEGFFARSAALGWIGTTLVALV